MGVLVLEDPVHGGKKWSEIGKMICKDFGDFSDGFLGFLEKFWHQNVDLGEIYTLKRLFF